MKFLDDLGKAFVPKSIRPNLRFYLAKAGIQEVPYSFFGIMFYVVLGITAIIYLVSKFFNVASVWAGNSPILIGILVFLFWIVVMVALSAFIMGGIAFYLSMKIYDRTKNIDAALADYLILVSTNLKGGLSFERSLWGAIKPEFGVLCEEMSIVSKKVMTGSDLSDALREFANKYDSPSVKRTMDLILGEIQSGGQIAKVLDQTIDSLRKTKLIKDEMVANTLMFTIFISAIVIVISPLLFALAYNLLSILISVSAVVAPSIAEAGSKAPFKFSAVVLDKTDFKIFSILALSVISICAAMIMSLIQKGDLKGGIKYVPFFLAMAILMYFFFMSLLGGFFGNII